MNDVVRKMLEDGAISQEVAEKYCPELKEIEGERIRKALMEMFNESGYWHGFAYKDILAWLEKQGEQKPVNDTDEGIVEAVKDTSILDMVEPKFHEGDWVVQEKIGVYKVIEVCESWYEVVDNKDKHYSIGFDKEYMCHLWTIQDAKDGDVLAYVTDEEDLWIMIYWSLYKPYEGHVHYYALLVNDDFSEKGTCCICIDNLKPATKEQRDQLEKTMADAGYTFDFDKKELKEIEQKPAEWSEEDETGLTNTIIMLKEGASLHFNKKDITKAVDWLKSLRPQNTWKPSEEQLKSLQEVIDVGHFTSYPNSLETLYEQLKELKG